MKIAVVGGGSTYTPELVSCLQREELALDELALHDIDAQRLDVVGGLARRMLDRQGFAGELVLTTELDAALRDADFVLLQLRVGGQAARLLDETVPLESGVIGQETTGPGGFAKALRTVPVALEIAGRAAELAAPSAWVVDFTNPVGIVTRALLDAGHRAIGLCNVAVTFQRLIARLIGVEPGRVLVDQVGLNHLTWIRGVRLDGVDVLAELLTEHGDELAAEVRLPRRLLDELGAIPSYYLRYYYETREALAEQRAGEPRAAEVARLERELLDLYRDPALTEKPAQLEGRGGAYYSEVASGLVAALSGDRPGVHVVDVRSEGAITGMAGDDVVELPARVDRRGADPLPQAPLPPECLGLAQHVAAYERLAAAAATSGDRRLARAALRAHPLVREASLADGLCDRLLAAGAAYLPQFSHEVLS